MSVCNRLVCRLCLLFTSVYNIAKINSELAIIMGNTLTALGFGLVAFAAACVRAKLSTITATNKLHT